MWFFSFLLIWTLIVITIHRIYESGSVLVRQFL